MAVAHKEGRAQQVHRAKVLRTTGGAGKTKSRKVTDEYDVHAVRQPPCVKGRV